MRETMESPFIYGRVNEGSLSQRTVQQRSFGEKAQEGVPFVRESLTQEHNELGIQYNNFHIENVAAAHGASPGWIQNSCAGISGFGEHSAYASGNEGAAPASTDPPAAAAMVIAPAAMPTINGSTSLGSFSQMTLPQPANLVAGSLAQVSFQPPTARAGPGVYSPFPASWSATAPSTSVQRHQSLRPDANSGAGAVGRGVNQNWSLASSVGQHYGIWRAVCYVPSGSETTGGNMRSSAGNVPLTLFSAERAKQARESAGISAANISVLSSMYREEYQIARRYIENVRQKYEAAKIAIDETNARRKARDSTAEKTVICTKDILLSGNSGKEIASETATAKALLIKAQRSLRGASLDTDHAKKLRNRFDAAAAAISASDSGHKQTTPPASGSTAGGDGSATTASDKAADGDHVSGSKRGRQSESSELLSASAGWNKRQVKRRLTPEGVRASIFTEISWIVSNFDVSSVTPVTAAESRMISSSSSSSGARWKSSKESERGERICVVKAREGPVKVTFSPDKLAKRKREFETLILRNQKKSITLLQLTETTKKVKRRRLVDAERSYRKEVEREHDAMATSKKQRDDLEAAIESQTRASGAYDEAKKDHDEKRATLRLALSQRHQSRRRAVETFHRLQNEKAHYRRMVGVAQETPAVAQAFATPAAVAGGGSARIAAESTGVSPSAWL